MSNRLRKFSPRSQNQRLKMAKLRSKKIREFLTKDFDLGYTNPAGPGAERTSGLIGLSELTYNRRKFTINLYPGYFELSHQPVILEIFDPLLTGLKYNKASISKMMSFLICLTVMES